MPVAAWKDFQYSRPHLRASPLQVCGMMNYLAFTGLCHLAVRNRGKNRWVIVSRARLAPLRNQQYPLTKKRNNQTHTIEIYTFFFYHLPHLYPIKLLTAVTLLHSSSYSSFKSRLLAGKCRKEILKKTEREEREADTKGRASLEFWALTSAKQHHAESKIALSREGIPICTVDSVLN